MEKPPLLIFAQQTMPTVLKIKNIDLSQVDFNDLSYSIAPIPESEIDSTLKASIARHGILHPPIVREINPVTYTIIAGRKRLLAWRSLSKEQKCHSPSSGCQPAPKNQKSDDLACPQA